MACIGCDEEQLAKGHASGCPENEGNKQWKNEDNSTGSTGN